MRLDDYDLKILRILSEQGRITKSDLADAIHLSITPCWNRVKKLEQAGIITGYRAKVRTEVVWPHTQVWVEVSLKAHHSAAAARFEQAMQRCPHVVACYATGGGIDYLLMVQARDIDQYQRLIDQWLDADLGIERYYTYIVTKTIQAYQSALPPEITERSAPRKPA